MGQQELQAAPALSTTDTTLFEDPTPVVDLSQLPRLSDEQLHIQYEVERTVKEIREGRWRRVGLQFPDAMLVDAPRVYRALSRRLKSTTSARRHSAVTGIAEELKTTVVSEDKAAEEAVSSSAQKEEVRLSILGDTSYGACCVDEIAAEHVDADVVVHYGRSCLSPTSRLPVIYVFTTPPLDISSTVTAFQTQYPDLAEKVILMADVPYGSYVPTIHKELERLGYNNVFATGIIHDPSSALPNRSIPEEVKVDVGKLKDYQLFHIAQPPTALLLTLSSRVGGVHIHPTASEDSPQSRSIQSSTAQTLRRRYALITSLTTTPIWGILINTLSVKNYLHIVTHVKDLIAAAGKKSYTFVVGKINPAKIANFSEIGGWVVIGCWESSLIESREFFRPVITPFELALALQTDEERVWTGEWRSDFQGVLDAGVKLDRNGKADSDNQEQAAGDGQATEDATDELDMDSDEDSAPPEFDLRTGRYISHTRPMRVSAPKPASAIDSNLNSTQTASSLIKRANGEIAQIGGIASPGAEFLKAQRTWQGLGSDFETDFTTTGREGTLVEEGRSGVARGYVVGDGEQAKR